MSTQRTRGNSPDSFLSSLEPLSPPRTPVLRRLSTDSEERIRAEKNLPRNVAPVVSFTSYRGCTPGSQVERDFFRTYIMRLLALYSRLSSSPFGSSCFVSPRACTSFPPPRVGGKGANAAGTNAQIQRVKRMICEGGLSFVTTRRGKWRRARVARRLL